MVTLEWDARDILDIYASYFDEGQPYEFMDFAAAPLWDKLGIGSYVDEVQKDGTAIGLSMVRVYSYYYRKMISLCTIDAGQAEIGNQVEIIWGDPGTRQKHIRATVARFPYLDLPRNEKIDVETIPRLRRTA